MKAASYRKGDFHLHKIAARTEYGEDDSLRMASADDSAIGATLGTDPVGSALPPADGNQTNTRSFYRIESGALVACQPEAAQVITYRSPTIDDESELQNQYRIDYHTLQSSLDPDELSRLEIESDHVTIIFKRPKSFCAGDNFLMKLTSTGAFLYQDFLLIVMADDSPVIEGRAPVRSSRLVTSS